MKLVLEKLRSQYSELDEKKASRQAVSVDGLRMEKRRKLMSTSGSSTSSKCLLGCHSRFPVQADLILSLGNQLDPSRYCKKLDTIRRLSPRSTRRSGNRFKHLRPVTSLLSRVVSLRLARLLAPAQEPPFHRRRTLQERVLRPLERLTRR